MPNLRAPLLQLSLIEKDNLCGLSIDESLDLKDIQYFIHTAALSGAYQLLQYYMGEQKLQAKADFVLFGSSVFVLFCCFDDRSQSDSRMLEEVDDGGQQW